jgi:hypothetical protein
VWDRLNINLFDGDQKLPWTIGRTINLPAKVHMDMMLIILWHIWKARNALIFEAEDITTAGALRAAIKDAGKWACRYKEDKALVIAWVDYLRSCCNNP